MKRLLLTSTLLAALIVPCLAGTDTAPVSHDGKDMKDMKQMVPVNESDAGFYVAAYGGAQFMTGYGDNRQTISSGGGTTIQSRSNIASFWGGVGGIKGGYNFNSFEAGFLGLRLQPALEAEALYIGNDDSHADNTFGPGVNTRMSTNSGDFFVNGILRFKNKSMVTPYLGIGAGLQYFTTHGELNGPVGSGTHLTGLNTEDLDFAAQTLVGFDVTVCNHISLFTEYKFIDAIGNDGHAAAPGGATYRFKADQIEQNLITAGVKYTF